MRVTRFSEQDLRGIRDIERALSVIVDGAPFILATIAEPLRELLGTDTSACYSLIPEGQGLALEQLETAHFPDPIRAKRVINDFLVDKVVGWAAYNPIRPERAQRNVALGIVDLDEPARQTLREPEFLPKIGLGGMDQLRVLVCEGPSLLAWVGAFQHEAFDSRQKHLLQRLVPALRKRLIVERKLGQASLLDAALSSALDAIGSPAFLITNTGSIVQMNAAGARLHARDQRRLATALAECARQPEQSPEFIVTRVVGQGCAEHFLVIARPDPSTELEGRASSAAARWRLTTRQAQVLSEVAQGLTNRVIAATLGLAERTVEVHLTAIFEKAQVENRAELVTKVWKG